MIRKLSTKKNILFSSLVVIVIVMLLIGTRPNGPNQLTNTPTPIVEKPQTLAANTKTVSYQLTFNKLTVGKADSKTLKKRVSVYISIKNTSGQVMQISPGLQMFLSDQRGLVYKATAKFLAARQVIGGPLRPNSNLTLAVDFEIPSSSTPISFSFQLNGDTARTVVPL